jgi:hypothetical protein
LPPLLSAWVGNIITHTLFFVENPGKRMAGYYKTTTRHAAFYAVESPNKFCLNDWHATSGS